MNVALAPRRKFVPSERQANFFSHVRRAEGSAILVAVAGSGKSTTILRALLEIPEGEAVLVLAFNAAIVREMREKLEELRRETGRALRGVRVATFHALGFAAVAKHLGGGKLEPNGRKLRDLTEELWGDETRELYGSFCCDLVSIARGQGVAVLCDDAPYEWRKIIDHHDLTLESEDATYERAIELSRELLRHSNERARGASGRPPLIDYDDMLYLPLLWKLRLFPQGRIFIDEAQDTNPVRRALAKKALRPGGLLYAVGDPKQAIYGFTGASHDALDLIKSEFNCRELPLTVSYRCPRVSEDLVREIVPYFEAHADNAAGEVKLGVRLDDALRVLGPRDAILCRNVAPMVTLAYAIIARGRACHVLGSDIGKGLASLVKKMRAKTLDDVRTGEDADGNATYTLGLTGKLRAYRDREVEAHMAKGEERKAEGVNDRVECLLAFAAALAENERTVPKLLAKVEALFSDSSGVLTLSTIHRAKGREWQNVAVWRQDLSPSPWARQDWQYEQERNLMYVRDTRFMDKMLYLADDLTERK